MRVYQRFSLAALAASFLLLTGCKHYGTDLPKEYKDYLDYTFAGNYAVTLTEEGVINEGTDREQGYRYWDVTYTDPFGEEHTAKLTGAELVEEKEEYYRTQERFDVFGLHAFVQNEMGNIATQELWDEILSKHLDVEFVWDETTHEGDDCLLMTMMQGVVYGFDDRAFAYAKQKLSPEDGHCIANTNLTSLMQDDEFSLTLLVRLTPDADADVYLEKMQAIEAELLAYTGGGQNYMIVLKQEEREGSNAAETLYSHTVFLGEEFTPDPTVEKDSLTKAVVRHWEETYP